jgi:transposase InsO family protein
MYQAFKLMDVRGAIRVWVQAVPMQSQRSNRGIEQRLTKANHPLTNGQVERMNRTI